MAVAIRSLHQENIYFESHLLESDAIKDFKLIELLSSRQGNTVVHCATPNAAEYVHKLLADCHMASLIYHRRLRMAERRSNLSQFVDGISNILVVSGTMPAEISDARIRLMIHFNFPASLGKYIQETSVAGIDGLPARCVLLYLRRDKRTQKRDEGEARQVTVYAQSAMCRTKLLSRYAGSTEGDEHCGRCDNCLKTHKHNRREEKKTLDLDELFEAVM